MPGGRRAPHLLRPHRAADLLHLRLHELDPLELVRPPPVVGHARRRQAPGVAHVGIEIDGLVRVGQVLGLRHHGAVPRVVLREEVAIGRAPARRAGRRGDRGGADRSAFQVGGADRDLRAADEAEAAVVEIVGVEVVDRVLLRARPHEVVDVAVVERGEHVRHHVRHDVLADLAARVGEPVRELVGLRQQQQARIVVDEGRQDDDLRLDRVVGAGRGRNTTRRSPARCCRC